MTERTKLLLLIPHLGGGGAERVTTQLAQHLDPARFEVHLCLITADAPGAQQPPESVTVHRLNLPRIRYAARPLIHLVRLLRPQIILSNMAHLNFLILLLKPFLPRQTRVLIRQNSTASAASTSALQRQLYRHLYPRADQVICQSQAMADDLASHFRLPRNKLSVLSNPIDVATIRARSASIAPQLNSAPRLLAIGRLAHEKGFDLLLHALALLKDRYPQLQLSILGVGPEATTLHQLAANLNLNESVTFAGYADPAPYYTRTTLFVLPSRHEGMPNALLEAAAAGLPIVATPCSTGLTNLLNNSPGAWIAKETTVEALAQALAFSLETLQAPAAAHRFDHAFLAPFETRAAIRAYEALLQQTATESALETRA